MEGSTKRDVDSFIKLTMGDLRGSAVVYGALPGEVLLSSGNMQTAEKLARALLDPAERIGPAGPVCPLCGGDTFRFLPDGLARCMLCSGSGRYEWKDGSLRFHIDTGDHPLFLTKDDVIRHAAMAPGNEGKIHRAKKRVESRSQGISWSGNAHRAQTTSGVNEPRVFRDKPACASTNPSHLSGNDRPVTVF